MQFPQSAANDCATTSPLFITLENKQAAERLSAAASICT